MNDKIKLAKFLADGIYLQNSNSNDVKKIYDLLKKFEEL